MTRILWRIGRRRKGCFAHRFTEGMVGGVISEFIEPRRLHGAPVGRAVLKRENCDFQVEEVLGFEPSGDGEHCFVWVEKEGWNSNDVSSWFAEQLGIRKRLISHCGLKDKDAVTRQWFSIHLPGQASPEVGLLEAEGIRILRMERGTRKLRRGAHDANRFQIWLREGVFESRGAIEKRWELICQNGIPNYYGAQRFGRNGGNIQQARELFAGTREVRDRLVRGILLSSARSALFNAFVARRITDGSWAQPMEGEVWGFADNRSLVLPEKVRGDEEARFANQDLELTAPLWGEGEMLSRGAVQAFEQQPIDGELAGALEQCALRQERRVIRLIPRNPELEWGGEVGDLCLRFELPKGTFATTVLRELVDV